MRGQLVSSTETAVAAADGGVVPEVAVLVLEEDRAAVGVDARGEAGSGQLHQGEQALGLGLRRQAH